MAAMYIAAICHDFAHPGVTNDFLMKTRHPVAVMYNDKYGPPPWLLTLQLRACPLFKWLALEPLLNCVKLQYYDWGLDWEGPAWHFLLSCKLENCSSASTCEQKTRK